MIKKIIPLLLLVVTISGGCKYYKQDILFKSDNTANPGPFKAAVANAEAVYTIRPYDFIELQVFTNKGEMMIDPNSELARQIGSNSATTQTVQVRPRYLVHKDGHADLPMVGRVLLENLTHKQADSLLSKMFSAYYQDAFVVTKVVNRRVIVLGGIASSSGTGSSSSSGGRIIPLENESTNLIEVLAMAGGLSNYSRPDNIRIIRGDLKNPQVQIVDLSTLAGMRNADLQVFPNDIIYIEPGRRSSEGLRDISLFSPVLTSLVGILSVIVVLTR